MCTVCPFPVLEKRESRIEDRGSRIENREWRIELCVYIMCIHWLSLTPASDRTTPSQSTTDRLVADWTVEAGTDNGATNVRLLLDTVLQETLRNMTEKCARHASPFPAHIRNALVRPWESMPCSCCDGGISSLIDGTWRVLHCWTSGPTRNRRFTLEGLTIPQNPVKIWVGTLPCFGRTIHCIVNITEDHRRSETLAVPGCVQFQLTPTRQGTGSCSGPRCGKASPAENV